MTQDRTVRIAVCQTFCIDSDRDGNLRRIEHALVTAAENEAQLACFPETAILGWVNPDAHKLADPIPGPTSERLSDMARRHKLMIAIGLCEKQGSDLYDSAILIGTDGEILLKHRKINTLRELLDPPYKRGLPHEINAVETPLGKIGMLICADTFKEALVRSIGELKPDLLVVPFGWAADKEDWPDHGKKLAGTVSRAARWAGCPLVGTDLVGMISQGPWAGKTYGGQSVIADAEGNVVTVLKDRDAEIRILDVPLGKKKP
jgi:predicted amidohydrolase